MCSSSLTICHGNNLTYTRPQTEPGVWYGVQMRVHVINCLWISEIEISINGLSVFACDSVQKDIWAYNSYKVYST